MATLTVRDLEPEVQQRLRIRAARNQRSMEEEVRMILRAAVVSEAPRSSRLGDGVRRRFQRLGGVDLELPKREAPRRPPSFR
jgi:plasmid stability protein